METGLSTTILIRGRAIRVHVRTPAPGEILPLRPLLTQYSAVSATRPDREVLAAVRPIVLVMCDWITVDAGQLAAPVVADTFPLPGQLLIGASGDDSASLQAIFTVGLDAIRRAAVRHARAVDGVH